MRHPAWVAAPNGPAVGPMPLDLMSQHHPMSQDAGRNGATSLAAPCSDPPNARPTEHGGWTAGPDTRLTGPPNRPATGTDVGWTHRRTPWVTSGTP